MKTQDGETISWVSKYGSITFNQYGKEFPTGGMNEKGLVVELMWLDETRYPEPDQRGVLNVLQWIQYQLDNSQTIDEVIASDKKIRIAVIIKIICYCYRNVHIGIGEYRCVYRKIPFAIILK